MKTIAVLLQKHCYISALEMLLGRGTLRFRAQFTASAFSVTRVACGGIILQVSSDLSFALHTHTYLYMHDTHAPSYIALKDVTSIYFQGGVKGFALRK